MANIIKHEMLSSLAPRENTRPWLASEVKELPPTFLHETTPSLTCNLDHSLSIHTDNLKQIEAEGYQEGYQQGMQDGFKAGKQEVIQQSQPLLNQLNHLISSISSTLAKKRLELNAEIANLVLMIVQQFFIQQQHEKNYIQKQIDYFLTQLNEKEIISLALHPNDLSFIKENLTLTSSLLNLRLIEDSTLRLGGCIITTEHGLFDASIERQIDRLKQVLLDIQQGGSV